MTAAVAIGALVVLAVSVPAAPVAAATRSLTVEPATGLVDGQTVDITGTGWEPGWHVFFCEGVLAPPPGPEDCTGGSFSGATIGADGSFTAHLVVSRLITIAGSDIDCAAPGAACVIGAASSPNAFTYPDPATLMAVALGFVYSPPTVSAGSASVLEGNSGDRPLAIPVTLSVPPSTSVTVDWRTVFVDAGDFTEAHPSSDYTPAAGTLTFAPGDPRTKAVTIVVHGDLIIEPDEWIRITLSNPTNAILGDADGTGTILNDDAYPTLTPGVGAVVEGNSGTVSLEIPVELSRVWLVPVTVDWRTAFVNAGNPVEATPGTDYVAASGTLTFMPGFTGQNVTITVNGDLVDEPDELLLVAFSNPTNARIGGLYGLGIGRITNDDHASIVPGAASVVEGNTGTVALDVPVTLTIARPVPITVDWATAFVGAGNPHEADPATDYVAASGTLTFAPGQTAAHVTIAVVGDTVNELDEVFLIKFSNATNASVGGFYGLGIGGITNDDG